KSFAKKNIFHAGLPEVSARNDTGNLRFRGAVENDANFFESEETATDHLVEPRKNRFDFFRGFDDFDDDRQILRKAKDFVGVVGACAAVAADAAQNRRAGKAFVAQEFDNCFVQRFAVPFVGFADVDAHQRAFAFEFFVRHGDLLEPVREADSGDGKEYSSNNARGNVG